MIEDEKQALTLKELENIKWLLVSIDRIEKNINMLKRETKFLVKDAQDLSNDICDLNVRLDRIEEKIKVERQEKGKKKLRLVK